MEITIETDINEIFRLLRASGKNPILCTEPIPYYTGGVQAGTFTPAGDVVLDEHMLLGEDMVVKRETFIVDVYGNSMSDMGIESGDRLIVVKIYSASEISDGDTVLVWRAGEDTVKAFMRDETGKPWLVPRNANYRPFPLTSDMRITGRVIAIIKRNVRSSYQDLMDILKPYTTAENSPSMPSQQAIINAIEYIAPKVSKARMWFAVYRALADRGVLKKDDFRAFLPLVQSIVPNHPHIPTLTEMMRLNVGCFSKPFAQWTLEKSPFKKAATYNEYFHLAQEMMERLEE